MDIECERSPLITRIVKKRNVYSILFYSFGFLGEIYFSYIFWNIGIRFVRDLYYYSLSVTGFSAVSLQFLVFFVPPFFVTIPYITKYLQVVMPIIYILIWLFFSITMQDFSIIFRTIMQSLTCVTCYVYFDLKMQNENLAIRSRFIQSQQLAILISSCLRFATIGFIPFYYKWYYALIFIIIGLILGGYLIFEEIMFRFWKKKELKKLNWEYELFEYPILDFQLKAKKKKKAVSNDQNQSKKMLILKRTIQIITSVISLTLWSLGFSFLMYIIQRYIISPVSTSNWCGYPYSHAVLVIVSFTLGIGFSFANSSKTPLFFAVITFPSLLLFATISHDLTLILMSCIFIFSIPSLLQFYLREYNFLLGKIKGAVGLSSIWYVIIVLCASSVVLDRFLDPFGFIFGLQPYLIFVFGVIVLLISYLSFIMNRIYYIFAARRGNISTNEGRLKYLFWSAILICGFPQYYTRKELKKITKVGKIRYARKLDRTHQELLDEVIGSSSDDNEKEPEVDVDVVHDPEQELETEDGEMLKKEMKIECSKLTHFDKCDFVVKIIMIVIIVLCGLLILPFFLTSDDYEIVPFHESILRVSTFNIYQGYTDYGMNNAPRIVSFINEQEIDVIGFQETNAAEPYNGYQSIMDYVGINSRMDYYMGNAGNVPTIGAAFLSKHKIVHSQSETFDKHPGDESLLRPMITNEFVFNNTVFHMKTVHLDFNVMGIPQVEYMLKQCEKIVDPIIVVGDFNNRPNSTAYNLMIDAGFVDTYFEYHGYQNSTTHSDNGAIDYIFLKGKNIQVVNSKIYYSTISDHYSVITDLVVGDYS